MLVIGLIRGAYVSKWNKQVPTVLAESLLIQKESISQLSYSLKLLVAIEEGTKRAYYEVEQLRDVERYSFFKGVM